jgi:hypothetical protein
MIRNHRVAQRQAQGPPPWAFRCAGVRGHQQDTNRTAFAPLTDAGKQRLPVGGANRLGQHGQTSQKFNGCSERALAYFLGTDFFLRPEAFLGAVDIKGTPLWKPKRK